MAEAERIQQIMQLEGATELEATYLHHLDRVRQAWQEISEARREEKGRADVNASMRFSFYYKGLQDMIFSDLHVREHPGEWEN